MSAWDATLTIHIAAGTLGLLIGPFAMLAPKRRGRHTRLGEAYHWNYVVLAVSAVALSAMNWDEVWFLALVAVGSYAFAFSAYLAAKLRRPGWLPRHIRGQGGSYIAMTTALLVVNWENLTGTPGFESPLPWFLPTLIGTPLIAWTTYRLTARRVPSP